MVIAFEDKFWELHTYVGYGIVFLMLSRMVIEVIVSKEERLLNKIKRAMKLKSTDNVAKKDRVHYLFVKYGYVVFYALIFTMACTGLGLAYEDVPIFEEWHRPIKQIHELGQYAMYAYVALHLFGVIRADITQQKGIISGMVGGGK